MDNYRPSFTADEHIALCSAWCRRYASADEYYGAMARAMIPAVARVYGQGEDYERLQRNAIKDLPRCARSFVRRGSRLFHLNWLERAMLDCSVPAWALD